MYNYDFLPLLQIVQTQPDHHIHPSFLQEYLADQELEVVLSGSMWYKEQNIRLYLCTPNVFVFLQTHGKK